MLVYMLQSEATQRIRRHIGAQICLWRLYVSRVAELRREAWHWFLCLSSRLLTKSMDWLQVRWYSFQFLMQQMAEDLTELSDAISAVLQQMPNSNLQLS